MEPPLRDKVEGAGEVRRVVMDGVDPGTNITAGRNLVLVDFRPPGADFAPENTLIKN